MNVVITDCRRSAFHPKEKLDDVHPWSAESYYVGHRLVGIDTRTKAMMRKVLGILKDHCYIDNIKEGWHLVIKS